MANRGQADFQITVTTTSATGTFRDISQQVLSINGYQVEALLEQSDAFGDSWVESLYTGVRKMNDLTIESFFEDTATATGIQAIFGNASDIGAEREVELNFAFGTAGGTDVAHFDALVLSYERMPSRGALTRSRVTLRPSGPMTTAS